MTGRPTRSRSAGPATLLEPVRGGYGALQLLAPSLLANRLQQRLDPRARTVARLLGARQLVQALASGGAPSYPVLALGVEVDALHAASMLALAVVDRRRRQVAFADALLAGSFALAGALAARASSQDQRPDRSRSRLDALRDRCTDRLAAVLVPGYRARSGAGAGHRHATRDLTGSRQGTILPLGPTEKR